MTPKRVYRFGPASKACLVAMAVALIAVGIAGVAESYLTLNGVAAQFGGILVAMIPLALALFGVPALWQCRLELYDDHLEYYGVFVRRVIRKADIKRALSPQPRFGMFSVIFTLYGQPLHSVRIAILGHMDDVFARWMGDVPGQATRS